ncbi:putative Protein kinase [Leptomonas pyrrhocoris]|uniref:Protein kinase domain-containing protein n=1 Tax=Leptomonas pyrrhocoris TaxID=157538 RepID=A0A0M9G945_LEPPY|nr:putative Protein kinase [Leptomonas pyrrhocoris]KPA85283.1 putative Protein kinase [Leptomonas pyrrhocoris]|eukprot:XP_015663722.1 putative Protein kinase [Leptomonas pyrrhocoris]
MGNQLAVTSTVDLANVSSELELIAPLGAEGRNYFATFHCLCYTPLSPTPLTGGATAPNSSVLLPHPPPLSSGNAPGYTTDFLSADGSSRRPEYRPNSLYYPSAGSVGSPLSVTPPTRDTARGGGGEGLPYAPAATFMAGSWAATAAAPTTRIASVERAAWHQARWRQRLPVAARPWRVAPSHFVSEAAQDRCPPGEVMDRWCRDSTVTSHAFSRSSARRFDAHSDDAIAASPTAPQPSPSPFSPSPSSITRGNTASSTDIDATVAGVVGEWRGNYGNYVQLLLRGGSSATHNTVTSPALCDGQLLQVTEPVRSGAAGTGVGHGARRAFTAAMTTTMPSALSAVMSNNPSSSTTLQAQPQSYIMQDVVTKVFVRTPDDPGQTYFLNRVRQMMANAREQLSVVDSTLPPTTPRNCLWYTLVDEGDGFCVLQRPYVAFTVRERLAARPAWTAQEKLFVAFQILRAVAHLHETYGLTHGDIKPNNVLVQSTGVVVLCDMAPFKPWRLPLDSPLLFDYYYDTDESHACYVAPEKFSDQPLPTPPLESKTPGNATYNVRNVNFDGHTAAMDVFSTACVLLFLYREEDPFTLSEVLNLHHLSSVEQREKTILPLLRESGVPPALQPLLRSMLCSSSADRPSARELLARGLEEHVFPASFAYLYEEAWPRLLMQSPDLRLRLFQNQLEGILQHCAKLDAELPEGEGRRPKTTRSASSAMRSGVEDDAARNPRATAVRVLLPLLLQSIHSTRTSDEATFRGLLCLRQCVAYCSFNTVTDFVLPHLVYVVNNDAHVYGSATRLVAIRLLCSIAETVARRLTAAQSSLHEAGGAAEAFNCPTEALDASHPPDEEQWALMEHLVLPCLYDVLRQCEQESVAVLVEIAVQLPRLLLLTRFLTERRQVLYDAEDNSTAAQNASASTTPVANCAHDPANHAQQKDSKSADTDEARRDVLQPAVGNAKSSEIPPADELEAAAAPAPTPQQRSGATLVEVDGGEANVEVHGEATHLTEDKDLVVDSNAQASSGTGPSDGAAARRGERRQSVSGSSAEGAGQYLSQLRCLLTNGWNMLHVLYNHSCVAVAAAVTQQTSSTVAAFLGDERVSEDLVPLLTTALTAPLRVLRLLFPQAILLHALLQKPQAKTLRLFVEEGLRHDDDVCVKSTLDSLAVVVRSKKLPLGESMALVHQTLPFLMDGRLWLREAACGVVEAAAQSYPPSAVALHLAFAVRPLLTHPVPLSQLRRFAASIIRSELAVPGSGKGHHSASVRRYGNFFNGVREGGDEAGDFTADTEWSFMTDKHVDACTSNSFIGGASDGSRGDANAPGSFVDYRDALPSVLSATTSTAPSSAPALLHTLPQPPVTAVTAITPASDPALSGECVSSEDSSTLTYTLSAREAARLSKEGGRTAASTSTMHGQSSSLAISTSASTRQITASTTLVLPQSRANSAAAPHVVDLSPFPRTLAASHSSLCRSDVPVLTSKGSRDAAYSSAPSAFALTTATAASPRFSSASSATLLVPASTSTAAANTKTMRYSALRPIAAPISAVSLHTGAIYTAAAAPSANGVLVTAGSRGEAMVWCVGAALTNGTHTRDLTLVERVPVPTSAAAAAGAPVSHDFSYVASQWMDVAPLRCDSGGASTAAAAAAAAAVPATTNTVALASTDGQVRILDVERNSWLWSTAVGDGREGAPTGLALQDQCSLLVTTAAGGLHVVDTRCRGSSAGCTSTTVSANFPSTNADVIGGCHTASASAWSARLQPLDGAPSCVLPLYMGDRAGAIVAGTYGGVVCLFDLRYQLCAQRTVMRSSDASPLSSSALSITCACVDPLSSLCRDCRPSSWEPAVPGPSVLLATTGGTVYRLLLQSNCLGAYWPAFQCDRDSAGGIRCTLCQPSTGTVFTGTEDGYVRHWSTDHPTTSHTMTCVPYTSPRYTVSLNSPAAATADPGGGVGASTISMKYGAKHLARLTVRESPREARHALPHHSSDAILTLCAVQTSASPSASWSDAMVGHSYLLSGARDGSLILWNNAE